MTRQGSTTGILRQVDDLSVFARTPPDQVERDLAKYLPTGTSKGTNPEQLGHVSKTVVKRLQNLIERASTSFEQRRSEIEAIVAGLASGISVVLLGPPGTGKSALVRRVASLCGLLSDDGRYFEYLVTSHTMPEEIFGGPDLEQLVKGKIVRVTDGKLPKAEVAFLDEVFRGGSHILNTLLTILNEKRFDDGEGAKHVPLLGVVGASNTAPLDPDLEAFFDRFPVRVWTRSILEPTTKLEAESQASVRRLAEHSIRGEAERLSHAWDTVAAISAVQSNQAACTNDLRFARAYLLQRLAGQTSDAERLTQFERIFRSVRERCRLSDRTFGQLWIFGAALDFVRGKDVTRPAPHSDGHLEVFRHAGRAIQDIAFLNDKVEQLRRGMNHTGAA